MKDVSPDIEDLLAGYRRFRDSGWKPERERWEALREGQQPRVMVIACSDSRVDPSHIFDVSPGEIFVVRNVAALVPPFETTPGHHGVSAALEFAVQFLHVSKIVVMGHGMCGGIQAALTQSMLGCKPGKGGFVADWISLLDNARTKVADKYGTSGRDAERAMERAGVKVSLANLRTFPCVQAKEARGTLQLVGALFSISDGVLYLLNEETGTYHPAT